MDTFTMEDSLSLKDFNPFQGLNTINMSPIQSSPNTVTVHVNSVSLPNKEDKQKDVKQKRSYHRRTPEEKARDDAERAKKRRDREIAKARKKAEKAKKDAEKEAKKAEKSSMTEEEKAFARLTKHREKQIHQEETSASFRKKITFLEAQMDTLEKKLEESEKKEDDLDEMYIEMADKFEDDYEKDPDEELSPIPNIAKKSLVGFKLGDQNMSGELIDIKDGKYIVQVLELENGKATKVDQVVEMEESDLEVVG